MPSPCIKSMHVCRSCRAMQGDCTGWGLSVLQWSVVGHISAAVSALQSQASPDAHDMSDTQSQCLSMG